MWAAERGSHRHARLRCAWTATAPPGRKTTPPAPPPPRAPAGRITLSGRPRRSPWASGAFFVLSWRASPVPRAFPRPPAPARRAGRRRRDRGRRAASERRVYARGRLRRGDGGGDGRRPPSAEFTRATGCAGSTSAAGPSSVVGARGWRGAPAMGRTISRAQLLVHVAVVVHDLEAAILVLLEELALVNLAAAPESGFDGHARAERCVRLVERLLGRLGALLGRRGRRRRGRSCCGFGADERGGHAELALSVVVEHAERAVVVQRRDLARVVRALSPIIRLDGGADRK